jgi:UDP-N-acetylglucosamine acyltransferase
MSVQIHPSSIVHPGAIIEEGVTIGPFCIIDGSSKIGMGTKLRSHVVIGPDTELGQHNDVYPHCSLGMDPQDLKYKGTKTHLRIGSKNIIREACTMHRGTEHGGGITTVGNNSLFMTGSHIAHDCSVGNNNILANCTTLAGHVEIGDFCTIGAFSAIHQFCQVGSYAFMGGFTLVSLDALPYMKTVGTRNVKCYGVNTIGLRRHNLTEQSIEGLNKAYRILFHSNLLREQAIAQLETELSDIQEVNYLIQFIRNSKRGIHRG